MLAQLGPLAPAPRYYPMRSPLAAPTADTGSVDRFTATEPPLSPKPSPPDTPPDLLPVPHTRQSTSYSCGAGALQAVLMYYGDEWLESDLMKELHTDPEKGTNPKDIVRVAQELGYQAELRDKLTLADLEASLKKKVPVLIAAQAYSEPGETRPWKDRWEDGHYMVVIGMDAKNVYFSDPSMLGSTGMIPRAEFLERWHDVDDRPYEQSGIFITGKPPAPPPAILYVD